MKSNYLTFNKMKKIIPFLVMVVALTTQTLFAQVPSYVPTDGLVGYWPFNGNANDVSGNGNNGTVNGAILANDRNGNANSAYTFNGVSSYITANKSTTFSNAISFNAWVYLNNLTGVQTFFESWGPTLSQRTFTLYLETSFRASIQTIIGQKYAIGTTTPSTAVWSMLTGTFDGNVLKLYLNGQLVQSTNTTSTSFNTNQYTFYTFGRQYPSIQYFNGKLDDIGIWNRTLTDQEITNLYNSTSTNECLTMVINTGVLSTTPVTYTSTVNIYPNPANDQITIDCGNLANVVGWNIKITNMLGQEVFNQPMNTQQYVVPLNSWTGQGMYFVKIINAQNEVVNIKKIILQ